MDWLFENAGLVGLVFFVSIFTGIVIWAFQPGRKETLESYKYIPFSEEKHDLK